MRFVQKDIFSRIFWNICTNLDSEDFYIELRSSLNKSMSMDEQVELITQGDLRKALLKLALPATAMLLGVMLFEIIDIFWVGKIGADAIAAVSVAAYLAWTAKALANITAGGSNTLISRSAGSKKWDRAVHWFWRGTLLALIYSLFAASLGIFTMKAMLQFMELEYVVAELAAGYLTIFYLAMPLIFLFSFFESVFRALGNATTPAIITGFSLSLNVILDPILIFGWFGAPALGVTGASLASAISEGIGVLLLAWRLSTTTLPFKNALPNRDKILADFGQITKIGMPLALTGALFSLIYIFITKIVAQFGTVQIAAMGIGQRWEGLAYFVCIAMSTAVASMVGQNLGAGNVQRAKDAAYLATKYLLAFTFLVSLIFVFAGDRMAFILTTDHAVIGATGRYLLIIGLFETAMAFELGLEGAFLGSGNTWPPFFISVPLTFARIPVAWFLALNMGLGIDAVWWTLSASTLLKGILMGFWFWRGKWVHTNVRI